MYLLDTNVVSELRKIRAGKADVNVVQWAEQVSVGSLFISVITIQELEIGVLQLARRDTAQGLILRTWLNDHVIPAFTGRILPVSLEVAQKSALLHVPNLGPFRDGLIAATALVHGMTIVTRNIKDFQNTGANLLNPWD